MGALVVLFQRNKHINIPLLSSAIVLVMSYIGLEGVLGEVGFIKCLLRVLLRPPLRLILDSYFCVVGNFPLVCCFNIYTKNI